jgi:hypothetical protein
MSRGFPGRSGMNSPTPLRFGQRLILAGDPGTMLLQVNKQNNSWTTERVIIYKTESVIVELTTDVGLKGIGGASRYNGPAEMKEYAEAVVKPARDGKH